MKIKLITILIVLFTLAAAALATGNTIDLLERSMGARPKGMGGAFVALKAEIAAPSWNPAGLITPEARSFLSGYSSYFEDVSHYYVSYKMPFLGGAGSVSYINESVNDIPETTVGDDGRANVTGTVDDQKTVMALSFGRSISIRSLSFDLGATLKSLSYKIGSGQASGMGMDLGIIKEIYKEDKTIISFGAMARNLLEPSLSWNTGAIDTFERKYTLGLAYIFELLDRQMTVAGDVDLNQNRSIASRFGLEYFLHPILAVRTGVADQLTFGVGLNVKDMQVDYNYENNSQLGSLHQLSLAWLLPYEIRKKQPTTSEVAAKETELAQVVTIETVSQDENMIFPVSETGRYVVYAGATRQKFRIFDIKNTLRDNKIISEQVKIKDIWRLKVGPFAAKKTAQEALYRIKELGIKPVTLEETEPDRK